MPVPENTDERQGYHTLAKQVKFTRAKDIEQLHCDVAEFTRMCEQDRPEDASSGPRILQ